MKIGSKSILFGVHAFWWHPITVLLAWRRLYKRWPHWPELVAIACHDLGYWGCTDIDGPSGKQHPHAGALLTAKIVVLLKYGYWLSGDTPIGPGCEGGITYEFTLAHSKSAAAAARIHPSRLYYADKASIIFDPKRLYLLRARLSGEIEEYKRHMIESGGASPGLTNSQWYDIYKYTVVNRKGIKELL